VPKGIDEQTGKPHKPVIKSFEADQIKEDFFRACARKGFFSPNDKMRGRGAWTFRSGNLVYHSGDALWICEKGRFKTLATGVHENMLYPRLSALPEPWTEASRSTKTRRESCWRRSASGTGRGPTSTRCCCWAGSAAR
jgi:hypothetical protein